MKYKNWKQILALTLGFTLTFSQAAYATITMISVPFETAVENESSGDRAGIADAGDDNGVVSSLPAATAQSAVTATPTPTPVVSSDQTTQSEITKPVVSSEGAVLMDAATGQVLFGKNEDQQFYPASITKVMTALLVLERCRLDDVVTFSASATTNLEAGAAALGIVEGDQLTVEQCLYGLLLKSANEIGNGLAEHVAGSVSAFADLMNAKARELGCKNTNFVNPHGLNNTEHKTTPYDMALILRAALQNETFRKIDTTRVYDFPATKNAEARTITMGHKMMYPSDSRYYEGIIGGKTGYTSKAGNTLVTGAERNGIRLVAVVMKSQSTHYADTKAMLDFGFQNYEALTGRGTESTSTAVSSSLAAPESSTEAVTGPAAASQTGWIGDSAGWYYIKEDGSRASSEWLTVDGYDYWFDNNEYMATGWRQFTNGAWYYFRPHNGTMARNRWVEDGGSWYYLGDDGVLLTNTTTPDGYKVDENGIWIQ